MKKFTALLLVALSSLICLSGCAQKTINFIGEYWNCSPSTFTKIEEVLVYDVKVVNTTPSNSTELKNDDVSLEITEGTYTTTLIGKHADTNYYTFTTTLSVKGNYNYKYAQNPIPIENYLQTEVVFESRANGFKPISAKRTTYNSLTGEDVGATIFFYYKNGYIEHKFKYEYTIDYTESDAKTKLTYTYFSEDIENVTEKTFKNYSNGAYIDNNLLTLLPRAFNLSDGFHQTFKTIDVPANANRDMVYAVSNTTDTISQYKLGVKYDYVLNGSPVSYGDTIDAVRLLTAINDTFSGSSIESYYAIDTATHRHRMIKSYTVINDDIGYMEYTLKSATVND